MRTRRTTLRDVLKSVLTSICYFLKLCCLENLQVFWDDLHALCPLKSSKDNNQDVGRVTYMDIRFLETFGGYLNH